MTEAPDLTPEQERRTPPARRRPPRRGHPARGRRPPRRDPRLARRRARRRAPGADAARRRARRRPRRPPPPHGRASACSPRPRSSSPAWRSARGCRACRAATPTPARPQVATRPRPRAASSAPASGTAATAPTAAAATPRPPGPGVAEEPGRRRPAAGLPHAVLRRRRPRRASSLDLRSTDAARSCRARPRRDDPGRAATCPAIGRGRRVARRRSTARPGWWSSGARTATPSGVDLYVCGDPRAACVRSRCPHPDPRGSGARPRREERWPTIG